MSTNPDRAKTFWLEVIMFILVTTVAFIAVTSAFRLADYKAEFNWVDKKKPKAS